MQLFAFALLALVAACARPGDEMSPPDGSPPLGWQPPFGARWSEDGSEVVFRVASTRAIRIELWLYAEPTGPEMSRVEMKRDGSVWTVHVAATNLPPTIYYGYRVWGPNWLYDASWQPGSEAGWLTDVDSAGNRMNPNKLLFDPYALELSHDPTTPTQTDYAAYQTGGSRTLDSGPVASKAIVLRPERASFGDKPERPLRDDVIYEVHARGFTNADPGAGACAGTFAGAATRAAYLAELGVTAIELLPVQELHNDTNDLDPTSTNGDDYWGYATLAYFAPDRRYACDRSPGGPTREFRDMVRTFHEHGIKVIIDVVYNHTAEGGGSSLLSLRGVDNAGYYQLDRAGTGFTDSNGVGADLAGDKPLVSALVLDSLRYWRDNLGVDGFRFDLAPILGNTCGPGCFRFDATSLPATIASELGRPIDGGAGADLIAEPWAIAGGSYQLGAFPAGWAEWNDRFRDTMRADQNLVGVASLSPNALITRITGSPDAFDHDGRTPASSINFLVAHDGFTLHDLYACNGSNNNQPWPYGPSDGGSSENRSWDHGGDAAAQQQATRTGLALMMLSAGVPMITGGDELGRTIACNNNAYNLDSPASWLDWTSEAGELHAFAQRLLQFRHATPALRPSSFAAAISWRDAAGHLASASYLGDPGKAVLAWQQGAHYVAYNRGTTSETIALPDPGPGLAWYRVADTSSRLPAGQNFAATGTELRLEQSLYDLDQRSIAIFVAMP